MERVFQQNRESLTSESRWFQHFPLLPWGRNFCTQNLWSACGALSGQGPLAIYSDLCVLSSPFGWHRRFLQSPPLPEVPVVWTVSLPCPSLDSPNFGPAGKEMKAAFKAQAQSFVHAAQPQPYICSWFSLPFQHSLMPYLLFWPLLHIELSVAMPKSCPCELRLIQNPSACTSSFNWFPSSAHYRRTAYLSHLPLNCPVIIWWGLPAILFHLYKP